MTYAIIFFVCLWAALGLSVFIGKVERKMPPPHRHEVYDGEWDF